MHPTNKSYAKGRGYEKREVGLSTKNVDFLETMGMKPVGDN